MNPKQTNQPYVDQQSSDVYGFQQHKEDGKSSKENILKQNARIEKWRKMMPHLPKLMQNNDDKLKSRLRKGIPDGLRMLVWPILAEVEQMKLQAKRNFEELVNSKETSPFESQITLDVVRTFQNNHLFNIDSITSQSLYTVLRAISLAFQDMGYCQGLNYLVGSFLLLMNDEMVYWHIYSLLTKYQCIDMYVNPAFALKYFYVLEIFTKQFMPDVSNKLQKLDIVPFYYAAEWYIYFMYLNFFRFITLFSSILPMKIFLRVIDIFWYEQIKTIFRTALTIIKIRKDEILSVKLIKYTKFQSKNMEQAMAILKDSKYFYSYDPDKFVKIMTKDFIFSKKDLEKHFEAYNQKQNKEKENKEKEKENKEREKDK